MSFFIDKYLWQAVLWKKHVQTIWCEVKFSLEGLEYYKDTQMKVPLLFNSLFHDTTLNLARVHFESQHQKSGIYCLLVDVYCLSL